MSSRYRIVTRTSTAGGKAETHVSSVILTHAEALDSLDAEEHIASLAGYHTARLVNNIGTYHELVCTRGHVCRSLTIRETGPFDDTI